MVPDLKSNRLRLEKVGLRHKSEAYLSWLNDQEVYKYLESGGNYSMNQLEDYLARAEANENLLFWAIIRKDSGEHIGNIKIDPVHKVHNRGEYGILIGDKSSWGKGFAKEASLAVLSFAFTQLQLRKVTLGVVEENVAAVRLYEKMGFVTEGRHIDHSMYDGKLCNTLRMAFFRDSYLTNYCE